MTHKRVQARNILFINAGVVIMHPSSREGCDWWKERNEK